MPKSRLSKPLLPAEYIQKVESHDSMRDFKSSVYDHAAHEERLAMRKWLKPLSPDHPIASRQSGGFTEAAQRTYLHLYAMEGDVLALSELIGLGATPDKTDSYGITPLHLVFMEMAKVKSPKIVMLRVDNKTLMGAADRARLFFRLAWVARILIEQHANVKIKVHGNSLVGLSCSWQDWDTVTLLLKHGATLTPSTMSCLKSPSDKKQFTDLLRSVGLRHSRPPRVCPCWSGKLVPDCHDQTEQSYHLEYVCVCGSPKTYQKCCYALGKFVTEKWDPESQRILHDYDHFATAPKTLRDDFHRVQGYHMELMETAKKLGIDPPPKDALEQQKKWAADLLSKGLIDPAFAYAMERSKFSPQPQGRRSSHHLRKGIQTDWNELVDAYIEQGNDSRSKEEIERAAKIGSGNGALFRACEGENCRNVERTGVKFDSCAKCKFAVYCSRSCQKSAWGTHKAVCCSEDQHEQPLPSQDAIQRSRYNLLNSDRITNFLSAMDHMLSTEPPGSAPP